MESAKRSKGEVEDSEMTAINKNLLLIYSGQFRRTEADGMRACSHLRAYTIRN